MIAGLTNESWSPAIAMCTRYKLIWWSSWFSLVSSNNNTDCQHITEILFKASSLNSIDNWNGIVCFRKLTLVRKCTVCSYGIMSYFNNRTISILTMNLLWDGCSRRYLSVVCTVPYQINCWSECKSYWQIKALRFLVSIFLTRHTFLCWKVLSSWTKGLLRYDKDYLNRCEFEQVLD